MNMEKERGQSTLEPNWPQSAPGAGGPTSTNIGCTSDQVRGSREYQEDTILVDTVDDWKIAAVFDGHGGGQTSTWLEDNYTSQLKSYLPVSATIKDKQTLRKGIKAAYTAIDSVLRYQIKDDSGSTAIVGIWNQYVFIMINLGDSRGVLFNGDGEILVETEDHKPGDSNEKKRIEKAGGKVTTVGIPRINGQYAVSRSFGDFGCKSEELEKSPMSWEPDITFIDLDIISPKATCYLILASDGIWDEYETTVKKSHNRIVTQTSVTQALVDKAINLSYKIGEDQSKNLATTLIDVYRYYDDNATIVWCDILGSPIDIPNIVADTEKFEMETFSDDEDLKEEYLVSGSLISKFTEEMKRVGPDERRQISSWLQERLKNYIYILDAISINLEINLTSNHIRLVIVDIYEDPWLGGAFADPSFITDSFRDIMRRWKTQRDPIVDIHIFTTLWLLSIAIIEGMESISSDVNDINIHTPFRRYLRKHRESIVHPYRERLSKFGETLGLTAPEIALVIGFKRVDLSLKTLFGTTREEQIERIILSLVIVSMGNYSFKDQDVNRLMKGDPDPSRVSRIQKKYKLDPLLVTAVDRTDLLESTTETVMVADAINQFRRMKGRDQNITGNRFIVMSLCSDPNKYNLNQILEINDVGSLRSRSLEGLTRSTLLSKGKDQGKFSGNNSITTPHVQEVLQLQATGSTVKNQDISDKWLEIEEIDVDM